MKIHALQTGTVAIKAAQVEGIGHDVGRLLNTFLDRNWTQPLPIYAFAIEHPEGVIVVDTGETARTADPGYFPRWHPSIDSSRLLPGKPSIDCCGRCSSFWLQGHTPGQMGVIVKEGDHSALFAGDASHSQELMLSGGVDGVAPDEGAFTITQERIRNYAATTPTVYLVAHDPETRARLTARTPVNVSGD